MNTCPTCGKAVDPLRAPAVGVRAGKVVAFCSRECAQTPEGASPPKVEAKPEPPAPPKPDTKVEAKPAAVPAKPAEAKPESKPAAGKPEVKPEAKAEAKADAKADAKVDPKAAPKADAKGVDTKPSKKPTPPAGVGTELAASSGRVRTPAPDLDSAPVIEIVHEPASGVVTSARDERKSAPIAAVADLDEGDDDDLPAKPAPLVTTKSSEGKANAAVSGERTTTDSKARVERDRRDSLNARQAIEWLDDEPAAPVQPGDASDEDDEDVEPERSGGRGVITFFLVMILLAGGAIAAYKYVYLPRQQKSPSTQQPPPKPDQPPTMAPPVPDQTGSGSGSGSAAAAPGQDSSKVRAAVDKAREVLKGYLASDSPRVQRVAAMALSRTGDAAAVALLASMLEQEKDEGPRLDLAYALARAGDARGTDVLVAALGSQRRDIKLQAARLLALMNDKRAATTLASFLETEQLRLGVAEQLANLADQRAIDALEAIRKDDKAAPDDRARATIALGIAGRKEIAGDLRALLEDKRFNAFAAAALASLHDQAARPVLLRQLEVPSLRVGAARSLRRLDPDFDPTAQLPALVAALASLKDTEQIQVAEAIVLLAGPPSWSEHA